MPRLVVGVITRGKWGERKYRQWLTAWERNVINFQCNAKLQINTSGREGRQAHVPRNIQLWKWSTSIINSPLNQKLQVGTLFSPPLSGVLMITVPFWKNVLELSLTCVSARWPGYQCVDGRSADMLAGWSAQYPEELRPHWTILHLMIYIQCKCSVPTQEVMSSRAADSEGWTCLTFMQNAGLHVLTLCFY